MSELVTFNALRQQAVPAHRVYLKQRWTDAWGEPIDWLHCESLAFNAQPTVDTASLVYRYGRGRRPGAGGFEKITAIADRGRYFVKVEVDVIAVGADNDTLQWYGTIEVTGEQLGGQLVEHLTGTGEQRFTAYGLEQQLQHERIDRAIITTDGAATHQIGRGLVFNAGGLPNRSLNRAGDSYVFVPTTTATASYWSSRDIVEYLLKRHAPRDAGGTAFANWLLDDAGQIPSWDRPQLDSDRHTVLSLLNRLMSRQRLLSWFTTVAGNAVIVKPFTFANDPIIIPALGAVIPANNDQIRVSIDKAPDIHAALKTSAIDQVDKVICYGARRRSCFTVSFTDGNFKKGFSLSLESLYESGASGAGDYPAATEIEERRRRNNQARTSDAVRACFSRFILDPDTILWTAGDGVGGTKYPVAPSTADTATPAAFLPPLRILGTIPLIGGRDYSASLTEPTILDSSRSDELTPIVLLPANAGSTRWQHIELIGQDAATETGDAENNNWSAAVRVDRGDGSLWLRVSGQPQHVIAASDFLPLAEDEDIAQHDFRDALVTVAVEEDRYAEGSYPLPVDPIGKQQRILRIYAGDQYRLDYVLPRTVLGVDPATGALVRAPAANPFLEAGTYIRDDTPVLFGLAQLAYEWYGTARKGATIRTYPNSALRLGRLILNLDPDVDGENPTVNTPITSIQITIPGSLGRHASPGPIECQVQTGFAELDALQYRV